MYGQSMYCARSRGWPRSTRACRRVADDETADDEHAVPAQQLDRAVGGAASRAAAFALRVLGPGLEKRQVLIEDVLDAEEHVAESRAAHQRASSSPADAMALVMPWTM